MGRLLATVFLIAGWASLSSADTLADVRADLGALRAEIQDIAAELRTTRMATNLPDGALIDRVSTIESALQRMTANVENLEFRIAQLVETGGQKLTALERRICAMEAGCDPASVGTAIPLDQQNTNGAGPNAIPSGVIMTVTEQREFDQAREVLDNGDPATAAAMLREFASTYPGGPITQQAFYLLGQAETELDNHKQAARAFLSAYSTDPSSVLAADALFQLSLSFEKLGRTREACVTLSEVEIRFPSSAAASAALSAMSDLGCT